MTIFVPDAPSTWPSWYHPEPAAGPPPELPSRPDPAYAAGCQLVPVSSIVDVFGRCEWCRARTPGLLADCADPDCPGGAR